MRKKRALAENIGRFFKSLYLKVFRINDTPQKISLGLAVGVALGILPGTGPIAALTLAFIFRLNRASALLGSLLTNTWISFVTFIFAVKIGAVIFKVKWQDLYQAWVSGLKNFHLTELFKLSVSKSILPVLTGYLVIALLLGIVVYLITFFLLSLQRKIKRGNINNNIEK